MSSLDMTGAQLDNPEVMEPLLHRHRRDLSWDDVEAFYEDKNNFAMYLVLPIIVLVYGGCAVIYCIARCRRYLKRKTKKKNGDAEDQEPVMDNMVNEPTNTTANIPSIPVASARDGATTSSEVRVNVNNDRETPLPWQVPGDNHHQPAGAIGGAAAMGMAKKNYDNRGYQDDYPDKGGGMHPAAQRPPPSYDETYKPPMRPMSKPPPYEEKGIRERRGSVEEIITLDARPMPEQNHYNDRRADPPPMMNGPMDDRRNEDRKRPRPGSRPSSRNTANNDYRKEPMDEEREKARQLVRGDRPMRREAPGPDRVDRQRTPDIISHARTKPLHAPYKPVPQRNNNADASLMARQAAQLLRLDQMGKQQGKKQKRLVFVAE